MNYNIEFCWGNILKHVLIFLLLQVEIQKI